ncbi:MAG: ATP-binding protein [Verrucomicrobiae bacterium]|nr:ATP-binding protein [Verrucomicrobiae bacterium]
MPDILSMENTSSYYPRPLTSSIKVAMKDTPVICLLGPRQCGKSTLVRTAFAKHTYLNLDQEEILLTALQDPAGFVKNLPERVILDEVQRAPRLLRAIKTSVDNDRRPGRFILTGSANILLLPQLSDSLAGRMEVLQLHPFSEAEKEHHPGKFLKDFLANKIKPRIEGSDTKESSPSLQERLVAGGYPEPLKRSPIRARQWYHNYLKSIIERDIHDVAKVRDAHQVITLLRLLSFSTAQLINTTSLSNALRIDRKTVEHYLSILEKIFLIRFLHPWHPNNGKRLIKNPKLHFLDTGLAAALAGLKATDWISQRERFGHLLESFVVQQLIAQAGWTDPELRFWHYRDHDKVEVDLVITRGEETWGIEVKAAASINEHDGQGLRRLADRCGKNFQGGLVFHNGNTTFPLSDKRFLALPLKKLWEG